MSSPDRVETRDTSSLRAARANAVYLAILKGHRNGIAVRALCEDLLYNPSRSAEWTRDSIEQALDDLAADGRVRFDFSNVSGGHTCPPRQFGPGPAAFLS